MAWLRSFRDQIRASWWGRILAEHDTEPVELSGGALKVLLGCWLLLPLDSFGSSPTFAALDVIPEAALGFLLLGVGIGHLLALRDGYVPWRRMASLIGFLVWFTFAATFVWSNPPAMGWLPFLLSAAGQGWCYIRLGGSA